MLSIAVLAQPWLRGSGFLLSTLSRRYSSDALPQLSREFSGLIVGNDEPSERACGELDYHGLAAAAVDSDEITAARKTPRTEGNQPRPSRSGCPDSTKLAPRLVADAHNLDFSYRCSRIDRRERAQSLQQGQTHDDGFPVDVQACHRP